MQSAMYRPSHKTLTVYVIKNNMQCLNTVLCNRVIITRQQAISFTLYTWLQNCATFIFAISLDSVD